MKLNRSRATWLIVGAVIWIFLTLAIFYWVQKPLGPANAAALARTGLDLGAAVLICLSGLSVGSWTLSKLRLRELSGGDQVVLGGGLGLGILGLATFGLGVLGVLSRWILGGVLVLLLLVFWRQVADAIVVIRSLKMPRWPAVAYVGVTLGLALLVALTPPTDWDGLFYHLTGPAWTLSQGHVGPPQADVPHLSFPALLESLFLLAMALRGDVAAKLLHWYFGLLLGGVVYRLARRHLPPRLGWGSVVALYATPMVAVLAGWAYNDLALAFFQVAALYATLNGIESRDRRWLGVAGGLSGLAMGIKYTSFICPLVLLGLIIWNEVSETWAEGGLGAARRVLRSGLLFGAVASLVASPWYLRNLAFKGNPVYPFAYSVLGGEGWSQWHADWYAQAGTGLGGNVGELLALPMTLTLGLRDMNYFDGRTGPLFLAALPAVLLVAFCDRRKPRSLVYLLWFALTQYLFWVAGVVVSRSLFQSRLLLTALVALCPVLSYVYNALGRLQRPGFSLQRFVTLVLVLVLCFNVVFQALDVIRLRPLPYLLGLESREEFLTRRLGGYYLAMQTVRELPPDAQVQFLWEPRSYYSQRVVQPDAILATWRYLCDRHQRDVDAIADALRARGVTHILLHVMGMDLVAQETPEHLPPADVAAWDRFRAKYLESVWEMPDAYILYTWR